MEWEFGLRKLETLFCGGIQIVTLRRQARGRRRQGATLRWWISGRRAQTTPPGRPRSQVCTHPEFARASSGLFAVSCQTEAPFTIRPSPPRAGAWEPSSVLHEAMRDAAEGAAATKAGGLQVGKGTVLHFCPAQYSPVWSDRTDRTCLSLDEAPSTACSLLQARRSVQTNAQNTITVGCHTSVSTTYLAQHGRQTKAMMQTQVGEAALSRLQQQCNFRAACGACSQGSTAAPGWKRCARFRVSRVLLPSAIRVTLGMSTECDDCMQEVKMAPSGGCRRPVPFSKNYLDGFSC